MRITSKRALTVAVAGSACLLMLATRSMASTDVQAYGVRATLVGVSAGPTPLATLANPDATVASLGVGNSTNGVSTGVMESTVTQDTAAGTESSQSTVNGLDANVLGFGIQADSVVAQCSATAGDTTTGSASIANGSIVIPGALGLPDTTIPIAANPAPNTVIAIPPPPAPAVLSITLNEQIRSGDKLTVNAIHVRALSGVGDLVVSSATCGPATLEEPNPVPIASGAGLYTGLGLAAVAAGTLAVRLRRRGSLA